MRNHWMRPLYAFAGVIVLVLAVRSVVVPKDFGIGERGYMYSLHRKGNESEWKAVPAKFQPVSTCAGCHPENAASLAQSPHAVINCQNCHCPAGEHPTTPPKLPINRDRALCLRCHTKLNYPDTPRGAMKGIDGAIHNAGVP